MTREEAIEIIKSECYVFNPLNFDRSTMVNTALDMAVKALEQEPCEDCVSREKVLKIINFEDVWLHNAESHNANTEIAFYSMLSKIKVLPYTQPKQRKKEEKQQ